MAKPIMLSIGYEEAREGLEDVRRIGGSQEGMTASMAH
jgi:hypothetical protein